MISAETALAHAVEYAAQARKLTDRAENDPHVSEAAGQRERAAHLVTMAQVHLNLANALPKS